MEFSRRKKESKDAEKSPLFEQPDVSKNLAAIKHKIAVISGKGGVGKSTVSANFAVALSQRNSVRVGLLDADIDGPNIPKMLRIEEQQISIVDGKIMPVSVSENLKVISMAFLLQDKNMPVIWRGPMKASAIRQFLGDVSWGALDYLIIDLPPGTGDAPLSIAQLIEGMDGMIVVTTSQEVALMDSRKAINFAKALNVPVIGVIENMSGLKCPYCGKKIDLFTTGGGERAALQFGVPFLGRVPFEPEIVKAADFGLPFVRQYPSSEAAEAFTQIVAEVIEFVEGDDSA
ncbi:Mrp/NBP35 family ATP-binding protein [Candidatus Poribacteria bacterium]|nr:Mrp/NBP35 family ATP-binding protein [Candidatus Poribacteria bacterium]